MNVIHVNNVHLNNRSLVSCPEACKRAHASIVCSFSILSICARPTCNNPQTIMKSKYVRFVSGTQQKLETVREIRQSAFLYQFKHMEQNIMFFYSTNDIGGNLMLLLYVIYGHYEVFQHRVKRARYNFCLLYTSRCV